MQPAPKGDPKIGFPGYGNTAMKSVQQDNWGTRKVLKDGTFLNENSGQPKGLTAIPIFCMLFIHLFDILLDGHRHTWRIWRRCRDIQDQVMIQ